MKSSVFGQTSRSFVFNCKRSISRRGSYEVNKVVKNDQEPTYRGFSTFDEIALAENDGGHLETDDKGGKKNPTAMFEF